MKIGGTGPGNPPGMYLRMGPILLNLDQEVIILIIHHPNRLPLHLELRL